MKPHWVLHFLLVIFSTQLVPLEEWIVTLHSNNFQEEICESLDCNEQLKESIDESITYTNSIHSLTLYNETLVVPNCKLHPLKSILYNWLSSDIPTPPPLFNA